MQKFGRPFIECGFDKRLVGVAIAFDWKDKELIFLVGPLSMVIRITQFNRGPWIEFNNK